MRRKLLDAAQILGISDSLMKVIGKRAMVDKVIVYGGMIIIVLIIFVGWWFLVK